MQSLSPEQRSAIAGKAANARWSKDKVRRSEIRDQQAPAPATKLRRPVRPAPAPKTFRDAHSYAEKRLAAALKERAQAMNKLAMLNAEIPSLIQIINALKGQQSPQTPALGTVEIPGALAASPASPLVVRIGRVQGGAGIPGIGDPVDLNDDEDRFLRESPVAGGDWH